MKSLRLALAPFLVLLLGTTLLPAAQAGPLRDAIAARRADKQGSDISRSAKTKQESTLHDLAYGPHARHRLDVYSPANAQGAQLILMVHGGAWKTGDKSMGRVVDNKVSHWVQNGIVFVSMNYRLLPEAMPDQQVEDVARALAYVQAHAREWEADPARVVLMGHSAGAHLVALLAASPALLTQYGAHPPQATITLDSAALDVVRIMSSKHYSLYDPAFGTDPAYWQRMSPLQQLNQRTGPLLLVCSSRRDGVCDESQRFASRARELGGKANVLPQDLNHGDINAKLGEPSAYTDAVDAFLRRMAD